MKNEIRKNDENHWLRITSVVLGFYYVLVIDFTLNPFGLQLTTFLLGLGLISVFLAHKRGIELSFSRIGLLVGVGVITLFLSINTNSLLLFFSKLTLFFLYAGMILSISFRKIPESFLEYCSLWFRHLGEVIRLLLSKKTYQSFFVLPKIPRKSTVSTQSSNSFKGINAWGTGFLTMLVLGIFHLFFSAINSEYASFVNSIFSLIWQVIIYIIELDIIILAVKTIVSSFFFYLIYSVNIDYRAQKSTSLSIYVRTIRSVLLASIGLFALFSFFQSKLLFLDFGTLSFKELSLYVSNGFWELLVVAVLGYLLVIIAQRVMKGSSIVKIRRMKVYTSIFTLELLIIGIFSAHKLGYHQAYFGFKDQRLLATVAVILLMISFLLLMGKIWDYVSHRTLFYSQVVLLLASMLILNIVNVDLLSAKINPIRYYAEGETYLDYSYLLNNSFDAHSEWMKLIRELEFTNPPKPSSYYWGWYSFMCDSENLSRLHAREMYTADESTVPYTLERYNYLEEKYQVFDEGGEQPSWSDYQQFSYNEYNAYKIYSENKIYIDQIIYNYCLDKA